MSPENVLDDYHCCESLLVVAELEEDVLWVFSSHVGPCSLPWVFGG